jgi:hypothetical protein
MQSPSNFSDVNFISRRLRTTAQCVLSQMCCGVALHNAQRVLLG